MTGTKETLAFAARDREVKVNLCFALNGKSIGLFCFKEYVCRICKLSNRIQYSQRKREYFYHASMASTGEALSWQ